VLCERGGTGRVYGIAALSVGANPLNFFWPLSGAFSIGAKRPCCQWAVFAYLDGVWMSGTMVKQPSDRPPPSLST
jgi:hypothetical protein